MLLNKNRETVFIKPQQGQRNDMIYKSYFGFYKGSLHNSFFFSFFLTFKSLIV